MPEDPARPEPQIASLTDADGIGIGYRRWNAHGDAAAPDMRPAVVIAHGASEHGGRYARFALALTGAGFDVLAVDHRGHGLTARNHGRGVTGPRGLDGIVDDLQLVVELAAQGLTGASRSVAVFGHSMGSVIALRHAERYPDSLVALALSGPIGVQDGAEQMRAQLQGALDGGLADTPVDALGAYNDGFVPARTPFDWLSRDPAEVDAYIADPDCGAGLPLTYGYLHAIFTGLLDGAAEVGSLPVGLPVLVTAGGEDPVSDRTRQVRTLAASMRAAGVQDVTETYYPQARHEILNELNREEVERDLVAWLTAHVG